MRRHDKYLFVAKRTECRTDAEEVLQTCFFCQPCRSHLYALSPQKVLSTKPSTVRRSPGDLEGSLGWHRRARNNQATGQDLPPLLFFDDQDLRVTFILSRRWSEQQTKLNEAFPPTSFDQTEAADLDRATRTSAT